MFTQPLIQAQMKGKSKLRVTGLCVIDEFPAERASNAENVSIDDVIMAFDFRPYRRHDDNDNEKTFIAKVVQRKSVNHTSTQFNLKDSSCQ